MPLSHLVPAYPSPSPYPQVQSLRLRLYSQPSCLKRHLSLPRHFLLSQFCFFLPSPETVFDIYMFICLWFVPPSLSYKLRESRNLSCCVPSTQDSAWHM